MKDENRENQTNQKHLESYDAVRAAPEHHKIIFEDERVRIMNFRVKPGEFVPLHTHRWASLNYVVSLSDFLSYDVDGNLKLDSRTGQFAGKEGEIFSLPAFPALHSVKNVGETKCTG
jgi:quercetin dioxygenase-like cupin family protein